MQDTQSTGSSGPWTREEFDRFHQALNLFPEGQWKDIAKYIGTRTPHQVHEYYQKYRDALSKRQMGQRRRRSWEENMESHGGMNRPNYFHPPPSSMANQILPSPRQRGYNGQSVESMYQSVLEQFPGTSYREKLTNFYYKHNPSKVNEVDNILGLFRNRELRLFLNLSLKYQLSQSMPQELISQRLRTFRTGNTPRASQDENLRMLSSIVPPPATFQDTRPLQNIQGHNNDTVSPNGELPTLRSYIPPSSTSPSTTRNTSFLTFEGGNSWGNEPQSYQV